ncbi:MULTISPECIES: zinc-dependent alcohol dehydrogenase family protein [unclassified Ruegeria]|uniref:zinc-dependent alcohol dehydrogenase family protein n=1 Tax=unclassified Ruegeria TaxID=2625375 RepID=UPI0014893175|nr:MULTISPECIES: zinc-dependent alcohol dehydrogenase family protein [unclassified Ruegeria]NOE32956.1 alcohol dehydrogenase catalytic domain-containing protein [Ruegeria sp. HKCCD7318]
MRAARLITYRQPLEVTTVPDPEPAEDGVVVRVLACGVCRSDWHAWSGADPDVILPMTPGHEYCGEVVAVGPRVTRWRVGDRVIAPFILACGHCADCAQGHQTICNDQIVPGFTCDGAFAEYIAVAHADANLTLLPDSIAPEVAAALGCRVTTAWQALVGRAQVQGGEWIAVFGGGGVGISTLLLGKALGTRVVVVDIADDKLDYAMSLGADAVVNATTCDASQAVKDITGGGAHVAIEALGIEVTTVSAMRSLRKLGRMVQIGMPAGDHTQMALPMDVLYSGQLSVFGTRGMPSWRYPSLLSMIAGGGIDLSPLVTRKISLNQVSAELAAFDHPTPPGVAVVTDFVS